MSIPALRFKEFSGDWEEKNLGEMTDTITSGSRDWAKYYSDSGCKFIRMTNLNRDGIQLKLDDLRFVDIKSSSSDGERTSLVQGDILMSITAELGKIGWIPSNFGKAFINQHTALIRIKRTGSNSIFVAHLLSTKKLNKQINGLNDAGAKAGLNLPTIKSICLTLPSLPEQTKIANFLTAVDEKISLLTQKADLLSQYKKGVMQQIFSQELRFKDDDGQEFPEWEDMPADKIFISVSNKNHNGDLPILAATQDKGMIYREDSGLDIKSTEASIKSYKIVEKGDFVISLRSFQGGIEYSSLMGICSPAYTVMKAKIELNNGFFKAFLKKEDFIEKLNGLVIGIRDGKQISYSAFATLTLPYPNIKEQTKIANFLTAIDEKITNNQTQLDAVKQYKQGLLQQMFV